jgi:hypothetical protein
VITVESATPMRNSDGASNNTFVLAFASLFGDISPEMLHPVLTTLLAQTLHNERRERSGWWKASRQARQNSAIN